MEKLQLGRKRKTDAEKPRMDPLMRALKALHSAGSPEAMTPEELEHQRRNQEILGRLTAPMAGMEYEELSIGTMPAAWTRLKAPHGDRRVIHDISLEIPEHTTCAIVGPSGSIPTRRQWRMPCGPGTI